MYNSPHGRTGYALLVAPDVPAVLFGQGVAAIDGIVTDGQALCQHLLSPTLYPMLYERGNCGPFRLLCYLDGHVASEDIENPYVMRSSQRNRLPLMRLQSFLSQVTRPLPKCLIVGDPDKIARLETEMKAEDKYSGISIYRSEPYFLEVVPAGIDKAASLIHLFSQLGIEREQLMAFGDGYNDLSMIAWAGTGIAMGRCADEIANIADFVTTHLEDDGIWNALKRYELL